MRIRLNKFLSQAGVASRREADRLIVEGRIKVNGRVVQELGFQIDDEKDSVKIHDRLVRKDDRFIYLLLNKPSGYLVTLKDPLGRPTVKSLLPALKTRIFPVGRLDNESEGLLLLTNDGELAYRLTHPRYEVQKNYLVKVKGDPDPAALAKLRRGIVLDGQRTARAGITVLVHNPKRSLLKIDLHEGRKREIRRMCQAIGHDVVELKRIGFAGMGLDKLKPGKWRHLTGFEIQKLKRKVELL
jgi:pseudouridine synthase